jgi:hypothetical protein
MSNWQPARVIDLALRFNNDFGPAMRVALEGVKQASFAPEDQCREAVRAIARGVGVATHGYLWSAPEMALTHVRQPVDVDNDATMIALRMYLNVPMNNPVDYTNGQAIAGFLQSLMGLPRGSLVRVEIQFPAIALLGEPSPLLSAINPATLPGQKLCPYCRNPMPDYEVQCRSCGARTEN